MDETGEEFSRINRFLVYKKTSTIFLNERTVNLPKEEDRIEQGDKRKVENLCLSVSWSI